LDRFFTRIATLTSAAVGQPWAFVLALLFIIVWGVSGPLFQFSDTWQLVVNTSTTIITFLMVFVIQNSQNRDAAAMQAKLDELIRVTVDARDAFIGIEHMTDAQLNMIRNALEKEVAGKSEDGHVQHDTVSRLIRRF
jgi:low affinity Fe/Cu permease